MLSLYQNPTQILTFDSKARGFSRGASMLDPGLLEKMSLVVENGKIKDFIPSSSISGNFDRKIDLSGKILLPGFVECHSHLVFAGNRSKEFRLKMDGHSYEEIAAKGGGINATVEATRNASFDELLSLASKRVEYFISQGVTSLEIKSGYGLSFYDEIKILQVIQKLKSMYSINIVSTFLGAHSFPAEYRNDRQQYINIILEEMLPYIAKTGLAEFCDGFCEKEAFSPLELEEIFSKAETLGMKTKIHTDQFHSIGGIALALKHNMKSCDHLEKVRNTDIDKVSLSNTVSVLLPGVSYFLNYNYAPARRLIAQGAILAISTDLNPGSCNIGSLSLIISLACTKMGMKLEEALSAYCINAAKALNLERKTGSLEIGKDADFAIIKADDYSEIAYNPARNLNQMTVKSGEIIYENN